MKLKLTLLSIILMILAGCSSKITATEAEEIALQTAVEEGYNEPELFTEYDVKTAERYQYSVKEDKDVLVWEVSLITAEAKLQPVKFQNLVYFIHVETGEIVHKVAGVKPN